MFFDPISTVSSDKEWNGLSKIAPIIGLHSFFYNFDRYIRLATAPIDRPHDMNFYWWQFFIKKSMTHFISLDY